MSSLPKSPPEAPPAPQPAPCPLCGGEGRPHLEKPGAQGRYAKLHRDGWMYACKGCGVHFSRPMPTRGEAAGFYEREYNAIHLEGRLPKELALPEPGRTLFRSAKALYLRLRPWLDRLLWGNRRRSGPLTLVGEYGGRSVLDAGCAEYQFLASAELAGWEVLGVEPDLGLCERVRSLGGRVRQGFFGELEIPERFDAVTFWHVLGHVLSPESCLRAARKALEPGGRVFIETPNPDYPDYFSASSPSLSLWAFPEPAMRRLMERTGFQLADVWFEDLSRGRPQFVRRGAGEAVPASSVHLVYVGRAK